MAYLSLKKRGKHKYYIIRRSLRKNGKTKTQDLKYLGKDLSKFNLSEIEKEFGIRIKIRIKKYSNLESELKKIKENKYLSKRQLAEIEIILKDFRKRFKNDARKTKNQILERFKVKFISENTSMDYLERISFPKINEIENMLKNDIKPKNKSIIQIWRIVNTEKILKYLKTEPKINALFFEKIINLFSESMLGVKGFRKHERSKIGGVFNPSKTSNIKPDLRKLIKWFNKEKKKIHPFALCVLFHNKFEKIHPAYIGNGEIGRIIMNYQLSQFGYPQIIIPSKSKEEYYKVMDKAYLCLKRDLLKTDMRYYKDLIDFMHKQFVRNYWSSFSV